MARKRKQISLVDRQLLRVTFEPAGWEVKFGRDHLILKKDDFIRKIPNADLQKQLTKGLKISSE